MPFVCRCCGEEHDSLPEPAYQRPDLVWMLRVAGEEGRVSGDDDHCVLRGRKHGEPTRYFLRGLLPFRVIDAEVEGGWAIGTWVEVAEADFTAYRALSEAGLDDESCAPFPGRIANQVMRLTGVLGTEVSVQPAGADRRATLWFPKQADHLLARLQAKASAWNRSTPLSVRSTELGVCAGRRAAADLHARRILTTGTIHSMRVASWTLPP